MSAFPEINIEESKKTLEWGKQMIDAAVAYYQNQYPNNWKSIRKNYNQFNGIVDVAKKSSITKSYGKLGGTEYIDYRYGRTKIKKLLGEFLDMGLDSNVYTVNKDAMIDKQKSAQFMIGAMYAKEAIEAAGKEMDFEPLNGMVIPERNNENVKRKLNDKSMNEAIMQHILDKKIQSNDLNTKALQCLLYILLTSQAHAVIERNSDGIDDFRVISPENAIFQEVENDPFCSRSPFKGERKIMFEYEVLTSYDFNETEKIKLKNFASTTLDNTLSYKAINGIPIIPVYIIQWKTVREIVEKVEKNKKTGIEYRTELSTAFYEKNKAKLTKSSERGEITIVKTYKQQLYEIHRIGDDIYKNFGPAGNEIQRKRGTDKYHVEHNYINLLFDTVGGNRISLSDIIDGISELWNYTMFIIKRELRKIKGKVTTYNEAFLPKGRSMNDIFHEMTEHSLVRYNTAADGNISGTEVNAIQNLFSELNLGSANDFQNLVAVKNSLEYTLDRLTGINEAREGYSKATSTATGVNQNVEASQSITRDIFYMFGRFMQSGILMLLEKTKINTSYLRNSGDSLLLGVDEKKFLEMTLSLSNEEFGVFLNDGKKELNIKNILRQFFPQQINANKLTVHDVAKFEMADSFSEAIAYLEKGWEEINKVESQMADKRIQETQMNINAQKEMAIEDREDRQIHDKELMMLDGQIKERLKRIDETIKQGQMVEKIITSTMKAKIDQQKIAKQNSSNKSKK